MWLQTFDCQDSSSMAGWFQTCPNKLQPMNRQIIKCSVPNAGGRFFGGRGRAAELIPELRQFLASQTSVVGLKVLATLFPILFDNPIVNAAGGSIQTFPDFRQDESSGLLGKRLGSVDRNHQPQGLRGGANYSRASRRQDIRLQAARLGRRNPWRVIAGDSNAPKTAKSQG